MNNLTLSKFIEELEKLKEQGHGDKKLVFDDCYSIAGVCYDEKEDNISVY